MAGRFVLERDVFVPFACGTDVPGRARARLFVCEGLAVAVVDDAGGSGSLLEQGFAAAADAAAAAFERDPRSMTWLFFEPSDVGDDRFDFVVLDWRGGRARVLHRTPSSAAAVTVLFGPGFTLANPARALVSRLRLPA